MAESQVTLTNVEKQKRERLVAQMQKLLPKLKNKQSLLNVELQKCENEIKALHKKMKEMTRSISSWIALFADSEVTFQNLLTVSQIVTSTKNIAGVEIPIFERVEVAVADFPADSPLWIEQGIETVKERLNLEAAIEVTQEQHKLIKKEFRKTSQRINQFEEIRIPECLDIIQKIKNFLEDNARQAIGVGLLIRKKKEKRKEAQV